jgi:hypothetical protein
LRDDGERERERVRDLREREFGIWGRAGEDRERERERGHNK